jgi:septum site-determining protein MinD
MLAVAGGKGGSGKTTTALGLGRALARRGRRPLVVDCDVDMPDLHHVAGVEDRGGVDRVAAGEPVRRAAVTSTAVPGVSLLTAGDRESVPAALAALDTWDGPVVLDTPPGAGPDATVPLRVATRTLLVATDRPQSLEDVQTTAASARELDAEPVGLLLRRTQGNDCGHWRGEVAVLAETPTVETPLESPRVADAWARVGETVERPYPAQRTNYQRLSERGSAGGTRRPSPAKSIVNERRFGIFNGWSLQQ